jgi:uncharacterized surface protein with fasciclin (FAS1) repeats
MWIGGSLWMSNQSQQEDEMRRNGTIASMAVATALAFAAAPAVDAQEPQPAGQAQMQQTDDMLGVAQEHGFREWTRGVEAAGLEQRLGERPHTVFIADDPTYQRVPATRTQAWQTDPAAHRAAIGHTIVEGRLTRDDLRQREYVRTIDGRRVPVRVEGDRIWVGDAEIREADIAAGPGLIHQVDRVTWPDEPQVQPLDQPVREPVRKY